MKEGDAQDLAKMLANCWSAYCIGYGKGIPASARCKDWKSELLRSDSADVSAI